MDWNAAIETNREALKRILAMLVAMAGITAGPHPEGPEDGQDKRLAPKAEGESRRNLPRHLHRAVLRLLRPAEAAARRLIIVAARGLVIPFQQPHPRKAKSPMLRNGVGIGILMPRKFPHPEVRGRAEPRRTPTQPMASPRRVSLPLFDPLRPPFQLRRATRSGVPRISLPGYSDPFPVAPRRAPAPGDPIDAGRLNLRLAALASALDDLPRQARRFARWRAARDARGAQNQDSSAQTQKTSAQGSRARRIWPLRAGRPPGALRRPVHEIHDILNVVHGLAFWALQSPDTS